MSYMVPESPTPLPMLLLWSLRGLWSHRLRGWLVRGGAGGTERDGGRVKSKPMDQCQWDKHWFVLQAFLSYVLLIYLASLSTREASWTLTSRARHGPTRRSPVSTLAVPVPGTGRKGRQFDHGKLLLKMPPISFCRMLTSRDPPGYLSCILWFSSSRCLHVLLSTKILSPSNCCLATVLVYSLQVVSLPDPVMQNASMLSFLLSWNYDCSKTCRLAICVTGSVPVYSISTPHHQTPIHSRTNSQHSASWTWNFAI